MITRQRRLEIEKLLQEWEVSQFAIRGDGIVDVPGSVHVRSKHHLQMLPVTFGTVGKNFICDGVWLTHLKGSPRIVGGDFICSNNELPSLSGGPRIVEGDYDCSYNQLETMKSTPGLVIKNDFIANNNLIITLENMPEVRGMLGLAHNRIETLKGLHTKLPVDIDLENNRLIASGLELDVLARVLNLVNGEAKKFLIAEYELRTKRTKPNIVAEVPSMYSDLELS